MKICNVIRVYDHRLGGMPYRAKNLCEALVELGHDVTVLTTLKFKKTQSFSIDNGVKIHYLLTDKPGHYSKLWDSELLKTYRRLEPFDVLHSDSTAGLVIAQNINGMKKLMTLHGTAYGLIETNAHLSRIKGFAHKNEVEAFMEEAPKLKYFDGIIGVSEKEVEILKTRYLNENSYYLPHPINQAFFNNIWQLRNCTDDIFVYGMPHSLKGFDYLKPLSEYINITYAGTKNPGGKVKYLGVLSPEEIAKQLAKSKLYLNLSLYMKGFETTIAEAFVIGIPIVAPSYQVNSELKKTQYMPLEAIFDFKNVKALAENLEKILLEIEKHPQIVYNDNIDTWKFNKLEVARKFIEIVERREK